MNTEKKVNVEVGKKNTGAKKNITKSKKLIPEKFDKEGFFLSWGIGIVCSGVGVLIIWATKTAPEGASQSTGFTTAQRLARVLPDSTKETLAFIMGSLFVLFGIVCLFLGIKLVVKYLANKLR
jgi:hypothetical protein